MNKQNNNNIFKKNLIYKNNQKNLFNNLIQRFLETFHMIFQKLNLKTNYK